MVGLDGRLLLLLLLPLAASLLSSRTSHRGFGLAVQSMNTQEQRPIDLLFDSDCPVCMMEVEFLRKRDIEKKIKFTDLSSPDYDPRAHGNVSFSAGMRKIRAVLPDDSVVSGVEVFRQVYSAIGLGWMFEMTNVPVIGQVADAMYDIWAENRLRITGRGDLANKLREKADELRGAGQVVCDEDGCSLVYPSAEEDCGDDGCSLGFD